jgi:hypothetical protein
MAKPKDMAELRDQLLDSFELLKNDPKRMLQVKELTNTAGKVIGTVKSQLEYALLRGEEPEIAFMGKTSGRPLKSGARLLKE